MHRDASTPPLMRVGKRRIGVLMGQPDTQAVTPRNAASRLQSGLDFPADLEEIIRSGRKMGSNPCVVPVIEAPEVIWPLSRVTVP